MQLPLCANIHFVRGCLYGLRSSALRFILTNDAALDAQLAERADLLLSGLDAFFPSSGTVSPDTVPRTHPTTAAATTILNFMAEVYRVAHFPIVQRGRAMRITGRSGAAASLMLLPVLSTSIDVVVQILKLLFEDPDSTSPTPQQLATLLFELQSTIPGGPNALNFMNAALDKGIPFDCLEGSVLQFGQGAKARLMDGSFTDATSRIGTAIARNKLMTSALLLQHGLPVATAELVRDAETAVAAAGRIGYPVVVKPADLDGGLGVQVGLKSPEQVRKATANCLRLSPNVMVEQWVAGRDYRLVVFNGALIWAIERIPGGVTGDGHSSVEDLVAECNRNPLRGTAAHLPLKPLHIDDEALELLAEQGLSPVSVPPIGTFLRLRRAANIAMGGIARAAFHEVHPDNRLLAERAARALGLDLAGIDLLIPDIARSWLETSAAICEVNAQPGLGTFTAAHVYPQLLGQLVSGNGRIPVILVVGDSNGRPIANAIARAIGRMGAVVGLADGDGVRLNGTRISTGPASPHATGRILLRDRQTACAIICVNDCSVLDTGLPADVCNIIVLAGDDLSGPDAPLAEIRNALLKAIVPSCVGAMIIAPGAAAVVSEELYSLNRTIKVETHVSVDAMAQAIIQLIHC